MKTKVGRMLGVLWLCVACLGSLLSPLSAQEPKLRETLKGHRHVAASVAFSPDGRTLASGSYDGTIKLWNVKTGKQQATLKGDSFRVNSVAYSPDGKRLASAGSGDQAIKLWE